MTKASGFSSRVDAFPMSSPTNGCAPVTLKGFRSLFADKSWVEFVADFGHAKKFFPDADVFPSVLVTRKPDASTPPASTTVCVIPPRGRAGKGIGRCRGEGQYTLPREHFTRNNWVLETPDVVALLSKVRKAGICLEGIRRRATAVRHKDRI